VENFEPADQIGHSFLVYLISDEDLALPPESG
jgi:hypothetical protein